MKSLRIPLYLLLLSLACIAAMIGHPITFMDSDTWFHLDGGRYILQHQALPTGSHFSFLSPPRPWLPYFWLFDVLVYRLYTWWGYYGLIGLRMVAYLATLALLLRYLFRNPSRPESRA